MLKKGAAYMGFFIAFTNRRELFPAKEANPKPVPEWLVKVIHA